MATVLELYDQKLAAGVLTPDEDQRRAAAALSGLSDALQQYAAPTSSGLFSFFRRGKRVPLAPRGLYLHGGVGRGKSMMMDLFFAATPVREKRRVHFHAFMLEVHDFLHVLRTGRAKEEKDRIDGDLIACARHIAAQTKLLCFDEFQVRDVADAMILGRLFTALFAEGVVVVITSNIAPDRLYEDGLQRDRFLPFIALLKERLDILSFTGATDYRLNRLRGRKVYFWPDDSDAQAELRRIFGAVTDDAAVEPAVIRVKDREIRVPLQAREAAYFTFHDLCETPKSALDYLELVKRYRVFVVEGVPRLDDARRDAVARFILLVDTLYEHRAHLAMSAAAEPGALYRGTFYADAFPRAASRLAEMQAREYKGE